MALDPVTAGIGLVDTFISKFVKDEDLAAKLQAEARSQEFQGDIGLSLAQVSLNQTEAASKSIFVSGWRPFIGWICGFGLAYAFILSPLMKFAVVLAMETPPDFPVLDISELMPILLGMLGLGGLRTYEKVKGVSRET